MDIKQSTQIKVPVRLVNTSDGGGTTGVTYGQVSCYFQKQGGASTQKVLSAGDWTEVDAANMPGVYDLTLSAMDTDTVGFLKYSVGKAGVLTYLGLLQVTSTLLNDLAAALSNITSIKSKTDNLPAAPAAVGDVTAARDDVNAHMDVRLDVAVSTRLATAGYTAPDNAGIVAIKAKTDALPNDPVSSASLSAMATNVDSIKATVDAIKPKTDNLPVDPASETNVDTVQDDVGALTTLAAAIKAKTDNLPVDPLSEADFTSEMGIVKGTSFDPAFDTLHGISQAFQAGGTADSAFIAAIKERTDRLPDAPAGAPAITTLQTSVNDVNTAVGANATAIAGARGQIDAIRERTNRIPDTVASYQQHDIWATEIRQKHAAQDLVLEDIQEKTNLIPPDPTSISNLTSQFSSIKGTGYIEADDSLHDIAASMRAGGTADSAAIAAIKAKTDQLPVDPASEQTVLTAVAGVDAVVDQVLARVNSIPNNPALAPDLAAVMGQDFNTLTDSLHAISSEVTDTNVSVPAAVNAIKERTDRLPDDPTSATDAAAQYQSLAGSLVSLSGQIAAVSARTGLIPDQPVSDSDLTARVNEIQANIDSVKTVLDGVKGATFVPGQDDLHSIALSVVSGGVPAELVTNVEAIKAKTDNLPADPSSQSSVLSDTTDIKTSLTQLHGKVGTPVVTLAGDLAAVDAVLGNVQSKVAPLPDDPASSTNIGAAVSQLGGASYNPLTDNLRAIRAAVGTGGTGGTGGGLTVDQEAALYGIKVKTDLLPNDPASQAALSTAIGAISTEAVAASSAATNAEAKADQILAKMELYPQEPASKQTLEQLAADMKGAGFTAQDSLRQVSTKLAALQTDFDNSALVAPDNASIALILAKTSLLPDDPASNSHIDAAVASSSGDGLTQVERDHLMSIPTVVPDNASIAAIKAKTDQLPVDPASQSQVNTRIAAIPASFTGADRTTLATVKLKTDLLPADPASNSHIDAAFAALPPAFSDTDRDALQLILDKTGNLPPDPVSTAHIDTKFAAIPPSFNAADRQTLADVKTKTGYLPADPARESSVDALSTSLAAIQERTDRIPDSAPSATDMQLVLSRLGKALTLLYHNAVMDQQVFDSYGVLQSARLRGYDNAANAQTGGSTGLLYSMRVLVGYDPQNPTVPTSLRIIDV